MGKTIYDIVELSTIFTVFFVLAFSVKARQKISCPKCLITFYWYPIIGSIIGILILLNQFHVIQRPISFIANKVSLIFHFTFLGYFFYKIAQRKIINIILIIFIDFVLLILLFSNLTGKSISLFAIANGCLFLFCLKYFYEIFSNTIILNLHKSPIFIICCGIFIGTGIILPFTIVHKYLVLLQIPIDTMFLYGSLFAIGYLIMNLFFLKAMIIISKSQ